MIRVSIWSVTLACLLLAGCGRQQDAAGYFEEGASLVGEGRYDEAIEAYQSGLDQEPDHAVGINLLGMAYRWKYNASGDLAWKEKEIETFQRAIAADSTYWPALINLGATYYYLDRKSEAAPLFQRALDLYPENPEREQLLEFIAQGSED